MASKKSVLLGALLLVIMASGIVYVSISGGNVQMKIEKSMSTFYTLQNSSWVVSGQEYNSLYNGTKKLTIYAASIALKTDYNNSTNVTTTTRTATYTQGPIVIDTYVFDGKVTDKEKFPISHAVEIINGTGYIYQYDVKKLSYNGTTTSTLESPMFFGNGMIVSWDKGNYYSKITKASSSNTGTLTIKYNVLEDYKKYEVRLFDPVTTTNFTNTWDYYYKSTSSSYDTAWAASTGTGYSNSIYIYQKYSGGQYVIDRGVITFDTSAIPDTNIVTSGTLNFYVSYCKTPPEISTSTYLQGGSGGYPHTSYDTTDYGQSHYSGSYGSFSTDTCSIGWHSITLNAAGLSYISKTGTTGFMLRDTYDIANNSATVSSDIVYGIAVTEDGYSSYLTLSYTPSGSAPSTPTFNSPANGATNQYLTVKLNVTASDPDSDPLTVKFYNYGTGTQIGATQYISSGTDATVDWSGLSLNTLYYWYVTVYDGYYTTNTSGTPKNFRTIVTNTMTLDINEVSANAVFEYDPLYIDTLYTGGTVYLDIDHSDYGTNFTSNTYGIITDEEFAPEYFRKSTISTGVSSANLTFAAAGSQTVYIAANSLDIVKGLTFGLKGFANSGVYPAGVTAALSSLETITLGTLSGTITTFNDSTSSKTIYGSSEYQTIGYINANKDSTITSATMSVTGVQYGSSGMIQRRPTSYSDTISYSAPTTIGYIYMNYSVPTGATRTGSSWTTVRGDDISPYRFTDTNVISTDCWTNPIQLRYYGTNYHASGYTNTGSLYCYGSSGWTAVGSTKSSASMDSASGWISGPLDYSTNLYLFDNDNTTGVAIGYGTTSPYTLWARDDFLAFTGSSLLLPGSYIMESYMTFDVSPWPADIRVEIGTIGSPMGAEYYSTGSLTTTATVTFTDAINAYLSTCTANSNGVCSVPIYAYVGNGMGQVTFSAINVAQGDTSGTSIPVNFTTTNVQSYLDSQAAGAVNIPITITTTSKGIVQIDNIAYDYLGGNKTYTVTSHNSARTSTISYTATLTYTDITSTLPTGIEEAAFYNYQSTNTGVQPFGQTSTTPIYSVSYDYYHAYSPVRSTIVLNETLGCVTLKASTGNYEPTTSVSINPYSAWVGESLYVSPTATNTILDSSASAHDALPTGYTSRIIYGYLPDSGVGPTYARVTGHIDTHAAEFDGSGDYMSFAAGSYVTNTGDLTIAFWAKPDSNGQNNIGRVFDNGKFIVRTSSGNWQVTSDGATWATLTTATFSSWQYIVIMRRSDGKVSYCKDGTCDMTYTLNSGTPATGTYSVVGNDNGFAKSFDGILDNIRMWTYDLTETEASVEMNSKRPTLVHNLLLSLEFEDVISTTRVYDTSYIGQGPKSDMIAAAMGTSGQYIDTNVAGSSLGTTWTMSVWFNVEADSYQTSTSPGLLDAQSAGIEYDVTNHRIYGYYYNGATYPSVYSDVDSITPGTWYNAIFTSDGTNRYLYLNGQLVGSPTSGSQSTSGVEYWIGATGHTGGRYLIGKVSDARMYQRVISTAEIAEIYNSGGINYRGCNGLTTSACVLNYRVYNNQDINIWMWADYNSCSSSSGYYAWQPEITIDEVCNGCL